ncbi:hypothetical protein ZYGR_0U00570 [Zygosaccharomyces rouxii]|uniref:ZYRO0F10010p n=2 Tax=Zygosaccharomyces rouxii TaxID=4956 RepID=C5DY38_ZYGRC|nr:uncharacterized protein ZYRO0F10010g [Zygosaccharomyces rouxii]KAH9199457.1 Inositolphosphorylceramide synthase subunit Kei1-domain-containing protein [Zygosaccharomyces rouxii]GAV50201.1 hypothetical protein ZYGR_0U00570 [Zygosaccharomyces rouxii]CAR28699.1 ZYRO0F10010p [Zygosaccharomyces rouxii]
MKTYLNLPKRFLGFLPLYIGVEVALGVTILNKCSGLFGILALFTGHPLEFLQWVLYLWSIFSFVVYAQGLFTYSKPSLLVFSQIFIAFSIDTFLTCLFTLWFTNQWYTLEDNTPTQKSIAAAAMQEPNQGASQSFEFVMTIFITLASLIARLYFNFVLASFVQGLLQHPRYMVDYVDVEQELRTQPVWKRVWTRTQIRCLRYSKQLLT